MAEEQKKKEDQFSSCFQRMPFTEMMRKMIEKKMAGTQFDCAEMMSRMGATCCGSAQKEKTPAEGSKQEEKI